MTNTYKALSARGLALYGADVFEAEFDVIEERDLLASGHVEIAPRKYTVLSDNYAGGKQGDKFDGAFPIEHEAALIQGGHIERVAPDAPATKKRGDA